MDECTRYKLLNLLGRIGVAVCRFLGPVWKALRLIVPFSFLIRCLPSTHCHNARAFSREGTTAYREENGVDLETSIGESEYPLVQIVPTWGFYVALASRCWSIARCCIRFLVPWRIRSHMRPQMNLNRRSMFLDRTTDEIRLNSSDYKHQPFVFYPLIADKCSTLEWWLL